MYVQICTTNKLILDPECLTVSGGQHEYLGDGIQWPKYANLTFLLHLFYS